MSRITSPTVYVTYEVRPHDRFNRIYDVEHHLPLVMQAWQRYALERVTAFFLALTHVGTLAICECIFRDEVAIEAAFGFIEAEQVMADVATFSDISPTHTHASSVPDRVDARLALQKGE